MLSVRGDMFWSKCLCKVIVHKTKKNEIRNGITTLMLLQKDHRCIPWSLRLTLKLMNQSDAIELNMQLKNKKINHRYQMLHKIILVCESMSELQHPAMRSLISGVTDLSGT